MKPTSGRYAWSERQALMAKKRIDENLRITHRVCKKCESRKPICDYRILRTRNTKYGVMTYRYHVCQRCENNERASRKRKNYEFRRMPFDNLLISQKWPGHVEGELSGFLRFYPGS